MIKEKWCIITAQLIHTYLHFEIPVDITGQYIRM